MRVDCPHCSIIIGASSVIAQSLIERLLRDEPDSLIVGVTRNSEKITSGDGGLHYIVSDYSEASIESIIEMLKPYSGKVKRVVIANGILHSESVWPEKSLKEFSSANLESILRINTLIPALWLSRLVPVLRGEETCHVVVFSARIGSISDNQLGGWYSYRCSKSALNMFLKTAAIEIWRHSKNIKLLAFHPGTTDTPLSKPFQKNVPDGKLFSPDFVAAQLGALLDKLEPDGSLSYLDWNHKTIDW